MPREAELSLNERSFILQALQENVRLEDRALDACRPLVINLGEDYGTADIRLGKTRVLARVAASVTAPFPDRKFDGIFTVSTELSPLASPAFEAGRPHPLETSLTHLLDTTFRRSSALPTESLCLLAGRRVWALHLTLQVIAHDGSLATGCSVAALAALLHYRLPATSIIGERVTVYSAREREPVPLALLHWPLCIGLCVLNESSSIGNDAGENVLLVDPTLAEEQVCENEVLVVANREGEVCQIKKQGGAPTGAIVLLRCVEMAMGKVEELCAQVKNALDADAKRRDKGGLIAELSAENER